MAPSREGALAAFGRPGAVARSSVINRVDTLAPGAPGETVVVVAPSRGDWHIVTASAMQLYPESTVPVPLGSLVDALDLRAADAESAALIDGVDVTGVAVASAEIVPGDVFVAVRGLVTHGARHACAAVEAGAVAIVTDEAGVHSAERLGVPVLLADDPRHTAGLLADLVYARPSDDLVSVAVTGTNGKTTTAYFLEAALGAGFGPVALIGTVELRVGDVSLESPRTTLEAPALHRLMAAARERGVKALVTEASSQGIALHRLAGVRFDVVVFTNLQRDHLDFHHTMEDYFAAKAAIFDPAQASRGVIVVDDEWGARLARMSSIPVATLATHVGDESERALRADWRVVSADIGLDGVGSAFGLRDPDGVVHQAHSPIPGLVNVTNAATAIVAAVSAGVEVGAAIAAVACASTIPGRMERVVERGQGLPLCLVDYAHTPEALAYALDAVRPITPGRLVIVFGSDGDRDQGKRPLLGEVAASRADVLVITDENPRSEEPGRIRAAILDGVRRVRPGLEDVVEITTCRADAVRRAMEMCGEGDTVLVTGKGHERTQEIAGVFHRYNDRDIYREVARTAGAEASQTPS